jgi:uncharacterized protein (DUF1684 family)
MTPTEHTQSLDLAALRAYVRELEDETTPASTRLRDALKVAREALEPMHARSLRYVDRDDEFLVQLRLEQCRQASAALCTIDAALTAALGEGE